MSEPHPAGERELVRYVVDKWEEVLPGDLPDFRLYGDFRPVPGDWFVSEFTIRDNVHYSGTVDDVGPFRRPPGYRMGQHD